MRLLRHAQPRRGYRLAVVSSVMLVVGSTMSGVTGVLLAWADGCADVQVVETTDAGGMFSEAGHLECGPGSSAGRDSATSESVCMYRVVSDVPTWIGEVAGELSGDPLPKQDAYVWYEQSCPSGRRALITVPSGSGIVDGVVVTPRDLAIWARNRMQLPKPAVVFNPRVPTAAGPATFVGLPTWWWVANWSVRSQFTDAGPVWVDVTATPVRSVWRPGDGGRAEVCDGPGLPWSPDVSEQEPRACTYTYARSSATQPDHRYAATVTAVWRVTWTGSGGTGGVLPDLVLSSPVLVPVQEVQTIVTGSG